jgi:PilZ domain-containing protein
VRPREKQKEARTRRRLEVRYSDGRGPALMGYSGNVSASGMMIRTPRVFPPGTVLDIELRFARGRVALQGRVMWAREGPMAWVQMGRVGMGIEFIDPPADFAAMIASGPATPPPDPESTPG